MTTPAGLLFAAGGGRRMGMPKALVADEYGSWLTRAVQTLTDAGCRPVIVVLGAESDAALELLRPGHGDVLRGTGEASAGGADVITVVAERWADGMSASIRAGLAAAWATEATSALLTLVDLPDLPVAAVTRLALGADATTLRQAVYDGVPGHPVVIGRDHWAPVVSSLDGDHGARAYLVEHGVVEVECGDLWSGRDVDTPRG